jgi:hypothetical protein
MAGAASMVAATSDRPSAVRPIARPTAPGADPGRGPRRRTALAISPPRADAGPTFAHDRDPAVAELDDPLLVSGAQRSDQLV